ncbi:MAG: sugar phosphate nucleotidyltransferase [Patescibacteria group bacterium]
MAKITKLVLPVAGLGKRLLPLTRRAPKNLIKVCGKPLLEYVLEEAEGSGIKEVVLIINPRHRRAFTEYIKKEGKRFHFKFHLREQETPGGNGHAIVQAYDLLRSAPFIVRFCDDVVMGQKPITTSLVELFRSHRAPIVLLERVQWKLTSRFGVVATRGKASDAPRGVGGKVYQITKIVEKPRPEDAPSNLTIVGGYVLTPHIIGNLKSIAETLPVIADDALPLAVALQMELIMGGKVYGWEFGGRRFDCGTLEKLRATERELKRA